MLVFLRQDRGKERRCSFRSSKTNHQPIQFSLFSCQSASLGLKESSKDLNKRSKEKRKIRSLSVLSAFKNIPFMNVQVLSTLIKKWKINTHLKSPSSYSFFYIPRLSAEVDKTVFFHFFKVTQSKLFIAIHIWSGAASCVTDRRARNLHAQNNQLSISVSSTVQHTVQCGAIPHNSNHWNCKTE